MRKTLQGRLFDTDRSELIGGCLFDPPSSTASSSWWSAALYRSPKSRRYFLAGEGGFMSRWRNGRTIIELTDEEAREWAEEHLDEEVVKEHF